MKRKPSPFDPLPNAWAEAFTFILALLAAGYGLWVIWPMVQVVWLAVMW